MSTLTLPQSMVRDREAGIKANAQHVDDNFNALETAVNGKLDLDGTSSPTADISMASHKLTNVATPTASGDVATKGYVDSADLLKANLASPSFTGTPKAPTPSSATDNSTKIATTAHVINVLKLMYPVGAVYIGTQNTCPMGSLFGTWQLVASGKALWTGNGTNGNSTIAAGLPNITGQVSVTRGDNYGWRVMNTGGAFSSKVTSIGGVTNSTVYYNSAAASQDNTIDFKASSSNSIYGNSNTVQPPAYVVNVWRRTA